MIDPETTVPGPNDKFRSVHIFTDVENRGMEVWFCKVEGFNGVITEIERKIFIPEFDLRVISGAALRVADELDGIPRS